MFAVVGLSHIRLDLQALQLSARLQRAAARLQQSLPSQSRTGCWRSSRSRNDGPGRRRAIESRVVNSSHLAARRCSTHIKHEPETFRFASGSQASRLQVGQALVRNFPFSRRFSERIGALRTLAVLLLRACRLVAISPTLGRPVCGG